MRIWPCAGWRTTSDHLESIIKKEGRHVCGALPCVALAADAVPSSALYPTEVVEHTDGDCLRLEKILPQLAATREVITGDGYTGLLTLIARGKNWE